MRGGDVHVKDATLYPLQLTANRFKAFAALASHKVPGTSRYL